MTIESGDTDSNKWINSNAIKSSVVARGVILKMKIKILFFPKKSLEDPSKKFIFQSRSLLSTRKSLK